MKRKSKSKIIIVAVLIAAFWLFVLYTVQSLLVPKYQSGVVEGSMIEEYYEDESKHEVIMVGDCEVYENISTVELWKKYGITSYIRGSAQQLTWQSYYLLEDTLRYETPKVVVFNVLALKYNEPQSEAYNRMTLDGMRWSSSKVDAIRASMTEDENFVDYLFPLLRYHSRWSELTADDFQHIFSKDLVTHNGYYMRVDSKAQSEFPDPMPLTDYTLGSNAMYYLDQMTALCKEKGIELVLIKAPTEYPHWYDQWDQQIVEYAEENELSYINFIPLQEEMGLDMSTDTYDAGLHLNLSGAEKFADYFGAWLTENCDLTDYREDAEYQSVWQEKVERYETQKAEQYKELEENGKLVSFAPIQVKETNIVKNFIILAVLAALCLTVAACGGGTTTDNPDSTKGENAQTTTDKGGDTGDAVPTPKSEGHTLTLNGVTVSIDAPMASLLEKLGEPSKYFESQSCAFQGLDKVYTYGGVVIRTYPLSEVDYVLNVELKDDTVTTAEGIYIGESKARVTEVYGEPSSSNEVSISYTKGGTVLTFFFEEDVVTSIIYAAVTE